MQRHSAPACRYGGIRIAIRLCFRIGRLEQLQPSTNNPDVFHDDGIGDCDSAWATGPQQSGRSYGACSIVYAERIHLQNKQRLLSTREVPSMMP